MRSVHLSTRLDQLVAFLMPVRNAEVPELDQLHLRGARAAALMLLIMGIPVGIAQILAGTGHVVRTPIYCCVNVVVWSFFLWLVRRPGARRHAEGLFFAIGSLTVLMILTATWASTTGQNTLAGLVFVLPVAMTAFCPVRPCTALAYGVEIGALYCLARVFLPFTPMMPAGEAFVVAVGFGLAGALAAQSQRYVLAQMSCARTTAEVQARELSVARDQALEAARIKTQFLANMSHEIRTPMTAILGFTELVGQELREGPCSDEASVAIDTVHRNGSHLLRLLDDILDLSRLEVSGVKIERRLCDCAVVASDVVRVFEARAAEKGLALQLRRDDDAPCELRTDPLRLGQILTNLLDNAIKFTPHGQVVVRLRSSQLNERPAVAIEIRDTGMGMSRDQMERVFEAFEQVDSSHTRRFGGTGLGLAISRRLAARLGGTLEVQTELGQGSVFTLRVPALLAEERRSEERVVIPSGANRQQPAGPPELRGRILLAEDGPDNQRLVSLVLRKAGAVVEIAENGRIALERALAARATNDGFDLILMDMQMPEMDGYEATAQLRHAGYSGPIVALTAHAMVGDSDRCLDAGCDGYLSKPVRRERLIQVANEYMRNKATA